MIFSRIIMVLFGCAWSIMLCGQPEIKSFKVECEDSFDEEKFEYFDRIKYYDWLLDTLIIKLAKFENCAYQDSKGFAQLKGDSLFLSYMQEGEYLQTQGDSTMLLLYAFCDCPLEFEYKLSGLVKQDYTVFLNDSLIIEHENRFKTYPVSFDLLNGDTINYSDKYGVAQGLWIESNIIEGKLSDSIKWIRNEFYYCNGEITNGKKYHYRPDSSITVISTFRTVDSVKVDFFDRFGQKYKEEYYGDGDKYKSITFTR